MTSQPGDFDLPSALQWRPHWIFDPVPEWWIRSLDKDLQAEIIASRLEVAQQMLRVQSEALAKITDLARNRPQ